MFVVKKLNEIPVLVNLMICIEFRKAFRENIHAYLKNFDRKGQMSGKYDHTNSTFKLEF
jgi:hypothetical protein